MAEKDAIYFGHGGQLRSGFGKQALGKDSSSPSVGFGSSNRDACARLYASADHDKAKVRSSGGNQSQGAIYRVEGGMGKQAISSHRTAPCYGIGTEQRVGLANKSIVPGPGAYKARNGLTTQVESTKDNASSPIFGSGTREQREKVYQDAESEKTYYGRLSPGPCTYEAKSGMGPQVQSNKRSNQTTGLGFGERFNYDFVKRAKEQPAAGDYEQNAACGKQALSRKKTLPLYSFGTSTRDNARKVFISTDHEKAVYGWNSPGPVTASQVSSSGKQLMSKKKTQPRCAFGLAERFGKNYYSTAVSPGPGAYAA